MRNVAMIYKKLSQLIVMDLMNTYRILHKYLQYDTRFSSQVL